MILSLDTSSNFFGRTSFWIGSVAVFLCLVTAALVMPFSLLIPPAVMFGLLSFAFLHRPLILLAILVTVRMTLDHLSETTHLSIGKLFTISLSQALGIFLIVMSIALFFVYRASLRRFPLWKPFLLLILFSIVTSFYSIAPLTSLQEATRLISIFSIGFLAFIVVTNAHKARQVLLILLFSSLIPIFEAVRQTVFRIGLTDSSVDIPRIYGTFAHTNVLALYLFSLFAIMTFFFFFPTVKQQGNRPSQHPLLLPAILVCYTLLVSILLFLTYTRVAWVALFLFVLVLALWRSRVFLFPLIAIPAILFVFSPTFQERVRESFETRPDSSIVWRQEIWHDVTSKLRIDDKRLYGTGLDTFTIYAENLRGIRFGSTDSHNDFVKFYVEGGVIGLGIFLPYLGLIGNEIRKLWALPRPYRRLVVAFTLYAGLLLLSSLSDNIYKDTPLQWVFFILLGTFIALRQQLVPSSRQTSAR